MRCLIIKSCRKCPFASWANCPFESSCTYEARVLGGVIQPFKTAMVPEEIPDFCRLDIFPTQRSELNNLLDDQE